jgi:hypothetical protein
MARIKRASLLLTASLWHAAVIVSCVSARTNQGATAGRGKLSLAMTLPLMTTHFAYRPSLFGQRH